MPSATRHYLLEAKLDADGQRLLDMIYGYLVENGEWPVFRAFAPIVFKELRVELGMAIGRLHAFAQQQDVQPSDQQEVARVVLLFAGLVRVPAAHDDVALCIRVLNYLGQQAIEQSDKRDTVTLGEVVDALDLTESEAERLATLIWADRMTWRPMRGSSMKVERDLPFRLSGQQMHLADVTTAEGALMALSPAHPELVAWPERDSPIGWLHETIARLAWARREDVGRYLRSAELHHQEGRWDDSAVQLRKAFEQLIGDLSDAVSTARSESIPANQSKPKFDERLAYLKARNLLGEGERKILNANYSWLSENGAHPGIPDEIDGETKWVVATELLRLLVTRAINISGAFGP